MTQLHIISRISQGNAYFGNPLCYLLLVKEKMSLIETCKSSNKFRLTIEVSKTFLI